MPPSKKVKQPARAARRALPAGLVAVADAFDPRRPIKVKDVELAAWVASVKPRRGERVVRIAMSCAGDADGEAVYAVRNGARWRDGLIRIKDATAGDVIEVIAKRPDLALVFAWCYPRCPEPLPMSGKGTGDGGGGPDPLPPGAIFAALAALVRVASRPPRELAGVDHEALAEQAWQMS
jgi:hypothetical protein